MRVLIGLFFMLFSAAALSDELYLQIGNGVEIRAEIGNIDIFNAVSAEDDYNIRSGFIYKVKKGRDYHIGVGGGIASVESTFDRVDGFGISVDKETVVFIQAEVAKGLFFAQVYYSDVDFKAVRGKVVSAGPPLGFEYRVDDDRGPGFGFFTGVRFKIN